MYIYNERATLSVLLRASYAERATPSELPRASYPERATPNELLRASYPERVTPSELPRASYPERATLSELPGASYPKRATRNYICIYTSEGNLLKKSTVTLYLSILATANRGLLDDLHVLEHTLKSLRPNKFKRASELNCCGIWRFW